MSPVDLKGPEAVVQHQTVCGKLFPFLLRSMADIARAQLPPIKESNEEEEFDGFSDSDGEEEVEETGVSWEGTEGADVAVEE